jgi:hypothetical protein
MVGRLENAQLQAVTQRHRKRDFPRGQENRPVHIRPGHAMRDSQNVRVTHTEHNYVRYFITSAPKRSHRVPRF